MESNQVTGVSDQILVDSRQKFLTKSWLEEILKQKITDFSVKEISLFASGASRLWRYSVIADGQALELYGKYFFADSATRQSGLLKALLENNIRCPKPLFVSEDDRFLLYQAASGDTLLTKLEQLPTSQLTNQTLELIQKFSQTHNAAKYLAPLELGRLSDQLEKFHGIITKLLPDNSGFLENKILFARNNLKLLAGSNPAHGDLNPWNILIDEDRLGLIDFSEACLATPEFDLGIFLSSFDFLASTDQEKSTTALLLRDIFREKLTKQGLDNKAFRVSYYCATIKHLWVISAYGLEITKGQRLAKRFMNLSMVI